VGNTSYGRRLLNVIAAISSRFAIAPEILSLFLLLDLFRLSAATDPKSCYQLNKLITFGSPWDLSERIVSDPIPSLPSIVSLPAQVGSEPVVIMMVVGFAGEVADLQLISGTHSPELDRVWAYMRRWTFKPIMIRGGPACMRSQVYVYFKNRLGRPELIISGFTDPENPLRKRNAKLQ
jgi:hypothetical protein